MDDSIRGFCSFPQCIFAIGKKDLLQWGDNLKSAATSRDMNNSYLEDDSLVMKLYPSNHDERLSDFEEIY